jgi:hypothetical protein
MCIVTFTLLKTNMLASLKWALLMQYRNIAAVHLARCTELIRLFIGITGQFILAVKIFYVDKSQVCFVI